MRARAAGALAVAGVLATPAIAAAHVTVNPDRATAGQFVELAVRVPNEDAAASTIKLDLKLPPGFVFASYEPRPGWSVKVVKQRLAKPVQTDDGTVTEEVSRIVWTGDGKEGKIGPGQFMDFPLSVQIPDHAGSTLTFKALQTYSDGKVVRWIGPAGSAEPAPQVDVTAAGGGASGGSAGGGDSAAGGGSAAASVTPAAATSDGGGSSDGLAIAALVVGALGLAAGGAALATGRRARGRRS